MSNRLGVAEAEQLAQSWQLALRAQRYSPQTLKSYGEGLRQYLAWCTEHGLEPMVRANLNTWTASMLDAGATLRTERARLRSVTRDSEATTTLRMTVRARQDLVRMRGISTTRVSQLARRDKLPNTMRGRRR